MGLALRACYVTRGSPGLYKQMKRRTIRLACLALVVSGPALLIALASGTETSLAMGVPQASQIPVYVSDFELPALAPAAPPSSAAAGPAKNPNTSARPADASPVVYSEGDLAGIQARRMIDFFSSTLIKTLQKSGYSALRQTGALPESGVLLRGVFAEPGPKNMIRRALLGTVSPSPKFLLYVGTFNLGRPDQPLYELAPTQAGEANYGPVITMNSYLPLSKYELDKNPSEDDVQKICAKAVASLTALLKSNPDAFAQ
jgi:hypothetical protein